MMFSGVRIHTRIFHVSAPITAVITTENPIVSQIVFATYFLMFR